MRGDNPRYLRRPALSSDDPARGISTWRPAAGPRPAPNGGTVSSARQTPPWMNFAALACWRRPRQAKPVPTSNISARPPVPDGEERLALGRRHKAPEQPERPASARDGGAERCGRVAAEPLLLNHAELKDRAGHARREARRVAARGRRVRPGGGLPRRRGRGGRPRPRRDVPWRRLK